MFVYVLFILGAVGSINAQHFSWQPCPNIQAVKTIDETKSSGKWYIYAKYFNLIDVGLKCETANFTPTADGNFNVIYTGINQINGRMEFQNGYAQSTSKTEATYNMGIEGGIVNLSYPAKIISIKYDSYSVLFGCISGLFPTRSVYVFSRRKIPSKQQKDEIADALKKAGISSSYLRYTDFTNCEA